MASVTQNQIKELITEEVSRDQKTNFYKAWSDTYDKVFQIKLKKI